MHPRLLGPLLLPLLFLTLDCDKSVEEEPTNQAPVAAAPKDQAAALYAQVQLDGRGSYDPDGDTIWFLWGFDTVPVGSSLSATAFRPNNDGSGITAFQPDAMGVHVVKLIVTDGKLESEPVYTVIDVGEPETLPVANAGGDQTAAVGDTVTVSGVGSTGVPGSPRTLSYRWSLVSVPYNSRQTTADLSATDTVEVAFTPDATGDFVLSLEVTDGLISLPDAVVISVLGDNAPPVARGGDDVTVTLGGSALLDASGSSDAEGNPLSYFWELLQRPAGSATTQPFTDRTAVSTLFTPDVVGTFVVSVSVFDGTVWSSPDLVNIEVQPASGDGGVISGDSGADGGHDAATDSGASNATDAGTDAGIVIATDASTDAAVVVGIDAGTDAGIVIATDASTDAAVVVGIDAGTDAGVVVVTDSGTEAGTDAGVVIGTDAGQDGGIDAGDAGSYTLRTMSGFSGGQGTVTSDVGGIDCTFSSYSSVGMGTCEVNLPRGTVVTLTAAPAEGNLLAGWTVYQAETLCSGLTCTLTLATDTNVSVDFSPVPAIVSFDASPTAVPSGSAVHLAWSVRGVTDCSIEPGTMNAGMPSGYTYVYPAATTDYTLTCASADGPVTATATVTIVANDPPTSAITAPASSAVTIAVGESLEFSGQCSDDDAGGTTRLHAWNFGLYATPGSHGTAGPVTVVFDTPGVYTVIYDCADFYEVWNQTSSLVTVTVTSPP